MARMQKAKGKIVRRFGINLFGNPKYDRLLKRKPHPPGQNRKGKDKKSDYALYLYEKQKMKFSYGLSEKQFRRNFQDAKKLKGITGHNMLILLERRLDNVVFRLNFAQTRSAARQLVSHGHIKLNGRILNIPSAIVKIGDIVAVKDIEKSKTLVRKNLSTPYSSVQTPWLLLDKDNLSASVNIMPTRDMIPTIAQEQFIVEWYSK